MDNWRLVAELRDDPTVHVPFESHYGSDDHFPAEMHDAIRSNRTTTKPSEKDVSSNEKQRGFQKN